MCVKMECCTLGPVALPESISILKKEAVKHQHSTGPHFASGVAKVTTALKNTYILYMKTVL